MDEQDRRRTLGDVERHDGHAAPRAGRAQHVGRPDVAAARDPDVNSGPARQQKRKRHGAGQVAQQDRQHSPQWYSQHHLNGTRFVICMKPECSAPRHVRVAP